LSSLIVLITMLVWVGIRAGLAPLNRLRSEIQGRSPLNLTPLQIDARQQNVRSLVRTLNELLTSVRQNVNPQQRFIADEAHQLRTRSQACGARPKSHCASPLTPRCSLACNGCTAAPCARRTSSASC
jgi:hypothetical protein